MFKDYYAILDIQQNANQEEINSGFKRQAIKWHPDKNQDIDTTSIMQEINEARLILLDKEAREKYNKEYVLYKERKQQKFEADNKKAHKEETQTSYSSENEDYHWEKHNFKYENFDFEYEVYDEDLRRWVNNAQRQSVSLARKTIDDFKGMVKAGATAAAKEAGNVFITQIILGLIFTFIVLISKTCNH